MPSVSGLTALMMPSNLPVLLMPNGITTVIQKSVGSPKERKTILEILEGIGLEHWKGSREWVQH